MKTFLVPTDFSQSANNALNLAAQLVKMNQGKIILMHVVEPIRSYVAATDGMYVDAGVEQKYIDHLMDSAKAQMDTLVASEEFEGVEVEKLVSLGTIFSMIKEIINTHSVDMIIMGSEGVSGLDEVLIGSNTEKVVRTAPCPVLTVKDSVKVENLNKMLFASSLNPKQKKIFDSLREFQAMFKAHLHVLFVNVANDFYTEREILKKKDQFLKELNMEEKDMTFHIYNEVNEENGIIYFAEDYDIDFIAVATHQRRGLAHLISGSIAEDVVNHAKRPVLTFGIKYSR